MELLLRFLIIDMSEAWLFLMLGMSLFNQSVWPDWKKAFLFSLLFAGTGFLFNLFGFAYQPRILSMFVLMNLLLILLFKDKVFVAAVKSSGAFTFSILAEFLLTLAFNALNITMDQIFQSKWLQYMASVGYLFLLLTPALILRLTKFDSRRLFPQKKHNRYLLLLILVGSVEFLLILLINTSYILQQKNASFLVMTPEQQAFIQVLILFLFIMLVVLFRVYLHLTINRVEEETETPYLQNINDLLTAIRSIKHDAVNHFTAIDGFLKKGLYDLGREYVQHLLRETITVEQVAVASGNVVEGVKNPAVAALLHTKMARCLADRISFTMHIATSSQFSFVKPNDLVKVLGNLLDNAISAAVQEPEENRYIRMVWSQNEREQYLYIENSGPTIPAEKLNHIFQLGYTTKRTGEGGVGLAVVKKVIDRYGGVIDVRSENGVTSFRITFS